MPAEAVALAYAARAQEYTDRFGTMDSVHPDDLRLVTEWAGDLDGPVIDAGCGPGQWTDHLTRQGLDVEGVDAVPDFVGTARNRFPGAAFRVGTLQGLGVPDASLAGLLAWYSIIHTPPGDVPAVLREFARCVRPGGGLVLGFVDGEDGQPFDHAVTTAWYWSVPGMTALLAGVGFTVSAAETRQEHRALAAVVARRDASAH